LAAGRGSRLGSLTESTPKVLQVYRGRSLLEWHLTHIREAVLFPEIYIVGGFMYQKLDGFPINVIVNNYWERKNIGSSLLAADQILSQGETLVVYGDIFYESDLIAQIIKSPTPTIASVENWLNIWSERMSNPLDDLESFRINEENELLEIGQRVSNISEIQGQFSGVFSLNAKIWALIKQVQDVSEMDCTSLIQELLNLGCKLNTISYSGIWREFDLPTDFID